MVLEHAGTCSWVRTPGTCCSNTEEHVLRFEYPGTCYLCHDADSESESPVTNSSRFSGKNSWVLVA